MKTTTPISWNVCATCAYFGTEKDLKAFGKLVETNQKGKCRKTFNNKEVSSKQKCHNYKRDPYL